MAGSWCAGADISAADRRDLGRDCLFQLGGEGVEVGRVVVGPGCGGVDAHQRQVYLALFRGLGGQSLQQRLQDIGVAPLRDRLWTACPAPNSAGILGIDLSSGETTMGGPQRPGVAGSVSNQGRQLGFVGDREGDVCAPTAAHWAAVSLHGEVTIWEEPDVECGEYECFTASSVCPAERLRDRDVDRQSTHFQVATHGRMISCESPQAARPVTTRYAGWLAGSGVLGTEQPVAPSSSVRHEVRSW